MLKTSEVVTLLSGDIAEDRVGVNVVDVVMGVSSVFSVVWAVMWVEVCPGLGVSLAMLAFLVNAEVTVDEVVVGGSDPAVISVGVNTLVVTCDSSDLVTMVDRVVSGVTAGSVVERFGVLWEGIRVDASVSLVESDSRLVEVSEGVLKLSDVAMTLEGDIVEAVTTAVTCELSETVTKVVRLIF